MGKYSKTPSVGATCYKAFVPQKSLQEMVNLVESNDKYIKKVGVVTKVYETNKKKEFIYVDDAGQQFAGHLLHRGGTLIFVK